MAQVITTVAGTTFTFPSQPLPATNAPLGSVTGVATDAARNVYVADRDNNLVLRISSDGTLTVFAGNGTQGFSGDGGPAMNASLFGPLGVAADSAGNVYIADSSSGRIRRVSGGIITTVAGGGTGGDGGPATGAALGFATGVAVDSAGNVYIADGTRVRKVSGGIITTIAGNGTNGFSGDGGPATNAALNQPQAVAVDSAGSVYIADSSNNRIRKVSGGIITTIAGNGEFSFSADGGPAKDAAISHPTGVTVDSADSLYVFESSDRIRKISGGIITTVAGSGAQGFSGDGGPATSASLSVGFASGVAVDAAGNVYIGDTSNSRVRKVSRGVITTLGGNGRFKFSGDGGTPTSAALNGPSAVTIDAGGNIYVADPRNSRIRKISGGSITTVAGNGTYGFSGDGASATSASLGFPSGIAVDPAGSLYIADIDRIRKVSGGIITTIAGNGASVGDGGPAISSSLGNLSGIAVDATGNVYVAEIYNNRIRKISSGIITTVAGNGTAGFSGDGGPGTSAALNNPLGLAVDSAGSIYIGDRNNNRIRKISGGIITTIAGNGTSGFSGDGGPATIAALNQPYGVAVDSAGNVFIIDAFNSRIRKVAGGIINTIAGNGTRGFSGDGGPATSASLNPTEQLIFDPAIGLSVDATGNVYIPDTGNDRIREVLVARPSFQASPATLTFAAIAGAGPSAAQTIALTPSVPGLVYTASANTSWLNITPASGAMPQPLQVTADPTGLAPGIYSATITISAPDATPSTRTVSVSFAVGITTPGKLALGDTSIAFSFTQGAGPGTHQLIVSNVASGSIRFTATASGSFLSVAPGSGSVTAAASASLTITATPGSLGVGSYSGTIMVASPDTGQQIVVPVALAISAPQSSILLSQRGFNFTAVAQGGTVLPQSLGILNQGSGTLNYTVQASTQSGGSGWLSVSSNGGTVVRPLLDVSFVDVSVDASSLAPGTYSGQITVRATGASNSPQTSAVLLTVLPPGLNPGPDVRPTGLVFTGIAGASPSSQNITVANVTASPINFGSSIGYNGAGGFIKYQPTDHDVANSPVPIVVQPDFTNLSVGVHRAAVTLIFDDGSTSVANILTVVAPAGTSAGEAFEDGDRLTAGCSPTQLLVTPAQVGFVTPPKVGFPTALIVKVADDCGALLTTGSVGASFSNGDVPLSLVSLQDGNWTTTWQPANATSSATITFTAQSSGITGKVDVKAVSVAAGTGQPTVSGGPVSAATLKPDAFVAPGELIRVSGNSLANATASATSPALSQQLGGASVIFGGQLASLLYADAGQVLGLVPTTATVNSQPGLAVQRDDKYVVLQSSVIVDAAHPGIFTKDGSGAGQGLIYKANGATGTLADSVNPVKAGDTVVIYCTGLGLTGADGTAANVPSVSIGGQNAPVSYAGVALPQSYPAGGAPTVLGVVSAGLGGLYQITAIIPAGLPSGAVSIIVTSARQSSPAGVTLGIMGSASGNAPAITSINTAYGSADIGQNDFIEIHGTNLAAASAGPSSLTTPLGGVSVTVNGKAALLYFVSPAQINALTPLDNTIGPASVVVTNAGGSSPSFTANLNAVTPAFLRFDSNGHITATHADGTYLGPMSLGPAFTPAAPSETIVTYAVGFGLPSTPLVSGSTTQSGSLATLPLCQIGGSTATVNFAGLNGYAGLYQINLTIPASAPNGDNPLVCLYGGQSTPSGTLIAVQR